MFNPLSWLGPLVQIMAAIEDPTSPTVSIGEVTVTGIAPSENIHAFLGIPFAHAPRFSRPELVTTYAEDIDASTYGPACIQHDLLATATEAAKTYLRDNNITIPVPANQSESCLTINVMKPATANETSNLPVVVLFFGGGFLFGDDQSWDAMGKRLVEISKEQKEDVIFVSFNYRLSAYGFLGGAEAQAAGIGNLGLRDQRAALEWVNTYISNFGGNPDRVLLWGQSSGAISASLQLVAYDGNSQGLFHGAFTQSGAPLPVGSILNGQAQFDALASAVGCGNDTDKLQCLRDVPLSVLVPAVDATDGIFSENALLLTWRPSADGEFLTDYPQYLVNQGKIMDIPIVTGNVDDEGTVFSVGKIGSIKNDAQFKEWISSTWLPLATESEKAAVANQYPVDQTQGSPFGTEYLNMYKLNTQYKRISAFQGDVVFQAPRRLFVKELVSQDSHQSKVWVYLSKRFKLLPNVGSVHGSDVGPKAPNFNMMSPYMVSFANNLDPNLVNDEVLNWPAYSSEEPNLYLFKAGTPAPLPVVAEDNHRTAPFELLNELGLKYPL